MKYIDEFRDPDVAQQLVEEICETAKRRWTIMDVCGGQTHNLLRYGIEEALADVVELIHGPGCPVCVTPSHAIDFAQELARRPGVTLASFGDMLRVPGRTCSLLDVRASGGDVTTVYSPLEAVELASRHPDQEIVFLAVGFETTAPATALAILHAEQRKLENFSLLASHVCVLPAMESLMRNPNNRVNGFLAAGHVCAVTGFAQYEPFANVYGVPVVVTGFEPIDLLVGIATTVRMLEEGRNSVVNRYSRSVRLGGNPEAARIIDRVFEPTDAEWRGLGIIEGGGLRIRDAYRRFNAERRFGQRNLPVIRNQNACRSGDVLLGLIKPHECSYFNRQCTPDTPQGAPMVSSEGACAAYYKYSRSVEEISSP